MRVPTRSTEHPLLQAFFLALVCRDFWPRLKVSSAGKPRVVTNPTARQDRARASRPERRLANRPHIRLVQHPWAIDLVLSGWGRKQTTSKVEVPRQRRFASGHLGSVPFEIARAGAMPDRLARSSGSGTTSARRVDGRRGPAGVMRPRSRSRRALGGSSGAAPRSEDPSAWARSRFRSTGACQLFLKA
jgi:hypothetical protein